MRALIQLFLASAARWRAPQSRASTSVWTGFVFGFSQPTSTAGSGNQKPDTIADTDEFMALSLVVGRSWVRATGSMTFTHLLRKRGRIVSEKIRDRTIRTSCAWRIPPTRYGYGAVSAELNGRAPASSYGWNRPRNCSLLLGRRRHFGVVCACGNLPSFARPV
jgi:hypothetical protein